MIYHSGELPAQYKYFTAKVYNRIMPCCKKIVACKYLLWKIKIVTLPSLYILSLMNFETKNRKTFTEISEIHRLDTEFCPIYCAFC